MSGNSMANKRYIFSNLKLNVFNLFGYSLLCIFGFNYIYIYIFAWKVYASIYCSNAYNHLAAEHLERHSFVGKLFEEEISLLVDMSKNMTPKEILITLKQRGAFNVTTMKTVNLQRM